MSVYEDKTNQLMLIEAKGTSTNEQPGIPKLVPTNEIGKLGKDGLLNFDFINQPVEDGLKSKLTFEIKTVFNLEHIPENLKGIKVTAETNADIVLMM
jgi:hypothetical protein